MASAPLTPKALAARVASSPRVAAALAHAFSAVREAMLAELVADGTIRLAPDQSGAGGSWRVYRRKIPADVRRARDERIVALLAQGVAAGSIPALLAAEGKKASPRHVYNVRRRWIEQQAAETRTPLP